MNKEIRHYQTANRFNQLGKNYSRAWKPLARKHLSKFEKSIVNQAIKLTRDNAEEETIKTLDIGIGTGRITEVFLQHNVEHYGIDIASSMIKYCQQKFNQTKKIKKLKIHDIIDPLPADWGNFDLISAIRILYYIPHWQKATENIYQRLEPDGVFVFNFPNRYSTAILSRIIRGGRETGPLSDYKELRRVLTAIGFSKIEITGFARLPDVLYAWCDGKTSAKVLLAIERFLRRILGPTLFARMFYCTCVK